MRHRLEGNLTDRGTILEWPSNSEDEEDDEDDEDDDSNIWSASSGDAGSADDVAAPVPIVEDVPCQFDDSSTTFVREETGERVSTPAEVKFLYPTAAKEGRLFRLEGGDRLYEIRGLDPERDHRCGQIISVVAELARAD